MSIDLSAADVNVYRRVFLRPISPGRIWELHRAATTAWTLARERGFDEIAAIIEEEEARRRPPEPESEAVILNVG